MALPAITSNSPSAGYIAWTASRIVFGGNDYPIPAGSTNLRFTYWKLSGSTPGSGGAGGTSNIISTDTLPTAAQFDNASDTILFLNKSGIGVFAGNTTVVDGSLLVSGSILADAIGANQITTAALATDSVTAVKIQANAVTAAKILAGEINTNHMSAGAITASKLSIGSFTDNLVMNPYFEDWPIANAMPDQWSLSTGAGFTGATVTRETATVVAGSLSLGLAAGAGLQACVFSNAVPVVAGRDIYLGVYYAGTGAAVTSGILCGLYFYNAAGALIATQSTPDDITGGNTIEQCQHLGTAPVGAVYMQPLIITSSTTKVVLDNVEMAYRLQGVMIKDGGVTAANMAANSIVAGSLVAGAVTADKLESNLVLGTTISTRTLDGSGNPSGPGVDLNSAGFFTFDGNGSKLVELPDDPLLPATFRGNAEIDNLTVGTNLTVANTASMAQGSSLTMQSNVVSPTNPPTISTSYDTLQFAKDSYWGGDYRKGADTDGTNYFTCLNYANQTSYYLEVWAADGTLTSRTTPPASGYGQQAFGVCWNGTNVCVLTYTNNAWYIQRWTAAGVWVSQYQLSGTTAQLPVGTGWSSYSPTLGWDSTAGQFIIAQSRSTNGDKVRFQRVTVVFGTSVTWGAAVDTTISHGWNLHSVIYGVFDLGGAARYVTARTNANAVVWTTAGAQDITYQWPVAGGGSVGYLWNPTLSRFESFGISGLRYAYTSNIWTLNADITWYAGYNFIGDTATMSATTTNGSAIVTVASTANLVVGMVISGTSFTTTTIATITSGSTTTFTINTPATFTGTATMTYGPPYTKMSPIATFSMVKRAKLLVRVSPYASGTTGARVYLAKGATVPTPQTTQSMRYQSVTGGSSSSPYLYISSPDWSTNNNPVISSFPAGTTSSLQSFKSDTGGALIKLSGDGSGRVGGLSWTTTGKGVPVSVALPLASGYSAYNGVGGTYAQPVIYIAADGRATMSGVINRPSSSSASATSFVFATVAAGYRPAANIMCLTHCSAAGQGPAGRVIVQSDGQCIYYVSTAAVWASGAGQWLSLDNITYPIA